MQIPYFWAYTIRANEVTLLAFTNPDRAQHEREMLKGSDARTVGSITRRRVTEQELRNAFETRGQRVTAVRIG
jgi:hypothetical protein